MSTAPDSPSSEISSSNSSNSSSSNAVPNPLPHLVTPEFVCLFGLHIANSSRPEALALMESLLRPAEPSSASIFLVNAHTLNLAAVSSGYRQVLQSATYCLGDGTGVRWAARQQGVALKANLVGTDLIPAFLQATANRGYRYFLLGAAPEAIEQAAQFAQT
ncbi:MAG: WecB/TagA/CpsF family glycosyltransferase, partial [Elainella sp.]